MSLPRVLSLNEDGTLHMEPAREIQKLRLRHTSRLMRYTYGDALEIHAEFGPGGAEECGLIVRSSPDRSEGTYIGYNRTRKTLLLDTRKSSQIADVKKGMDEGLLELQPHQALKLTVFLDASVIEIFANGRAALTGRIYPTHSDSLGVSPYARGGRANLTSLDEYELSAISQDRSTT